MTEREAQERLWKAASDSWGGFLGDMIDNSHSHPGEPIPGKELHEIGMALGFIEERGE